MGIEVETASAPDKINPDDYNAVVQSADLLDIKLIQSGFAVEPALFSADKGELRFGYGCEFVGGHYREQDRALLGTFRLEAGSKKGRKWLLRAKSIYVVIFDIGGNPTEEAALSYLARVGRFACYPYFRAHFAELCSGAGIEMPPLPVIRGSIPRKITPSEGATS